MTTTSIPLNIEFSNSQNTVCDFKCDYNIASYSNIESAVCTNSTNNFNLNLAPLNMSCTFNGISYTVGNLAFYTPGIFQINGTVCPGNLLLTHSASNQPQLNVLIPINASENETESLQQITTSMLTYAPNAGEQTTQTFNAFNLQDIIPKSRFASFTGDSGIVYIVFGFSQLALAQETFTSLQTYITVAPLLQEPSGTILAINFKGPSLGTASSNEIYIDCQPVSESTESTYVALPSKQPITTKSIINYIKKYNMIFAVIVIVVFCIVIFILSKVLKNVFNPTSSSNSRGVVLKS